MIPSSFRADDPGGHYRGILARCNFDRRAFDRHYFDHHRHHRRHLFCIAEQLVLDFFPPKGRSLSIA